MIVIPRVLSTGIKSSKSYRIGSCILDYAIRMLLIMIIYLASNYKKAFFGLKSLKDNPVIIYIANYC